MSSFGEDLKRERELRGISLREIAESTQINIRYLEALERNDFSRLPGGVFNKGFVRAISEFIGIDEESMINAYLLEMQSREDGSGLLEGENLRGAFGDRFSSEPDPEKTVAKRRLGIALAVVLILILAALAYWFYFRNDAPAEREEAAPLPSSLESTEPASEPAEPPGEGSPPDSVQEPAEGGKQESRPAGTEAASSPVRDEPADKAAPAGTVLAVEVTLLRSTGGRLNCDNRQVEILDGIASGATLSLRCERFLIIDADDGGAVRVSLDGAPPAPLGEAGEKIHRRWTPESEDRP